MGALVKLATVRTIKQEFSHGDNILDLSKKHKINCVMVNKTVKDILADELRKKVL